MRILDSHVHLKHGDAARTEYSAETIVRTLDAAGIAKAVVFAMSTTTAESIRMAEAAAARFPDRLIPYVYALPSYEQGVLGQIEDAVLRRGFRGIKIHEGECRLTEYLIDPVIALAGDLGVPCLIDFIGDLDTARRLLETFPGTTIIIAHFGRYLCTDPALLRRAVSLAETHPNAVLDASGVVCLWAIEEAVRRIGSKRILFGTDGPHPLPDLASMARREIRKIQSLEISEAAKADILGANLARLLGEADVE